MIYKKNVSFPYPVFYNSSGAYFNPEFNFDIENLKEDNDVFIFEYNYEVNSDFVKQLLETNQATLYFILSAGENKFYPIQPHATKLEIPKNRFLLGKRCEFQLMIKANKDISYAGNSDLKGLYADLKETINVDKSSLVGFSNIITIEETNPKGVELFEKKVDPTIDSEFKVELTNESIVLIFKDGKYQFNEYHSSGLNNLYVYIGLQKALLSFIQNNKLSIDETEVDINEIDIPVNGLENKLYTLLKSKNVDMVSDENIDEVIYRITDQIVGKFTAKVRGYMDEGN